MQPNLTADIDDGFFPTLRDVAESLGADPISLLSVWYSESSVRANAHNPNGDASGIFQAMPATLRAIGFTGDHVAFRSLSATSQLAWALRYYTPYKGMLVSVGAIYVANFLPAFVSHAGDPSFVLTAAAGPLPWAYKPNLSFDANHDGRITVGELEAAVRRNARGPRWDELVARYASSTSIPDDVA